MGCIIDTCIFIHAERYSQSLNRLLSKHGDESLYISAITASELLHGVHRAKDPATRNRRSAFVEDILRKFPIIPLDLPASRIHAEIWAELVDSGQMIGSHDLWIAASCLAGGHLLITDNFRDFQRVPGLSLFNVLES